MRLAAGFLFTGAMLTEGVRLPGGFFIDTRLRVFWGAAMGLLGIFTNSNGLFGSFVMGFVCPFGSLTSTVLPILVVVVEVPEVVTFV